MLFGQKMFEKSPELFRQTLQQRANQPANRHVDAGRFAATRAGHIQHLDFRVPLQPAHNSREILLHRRVISNASHGLRCCNKINGQGEPPSGLPYTQIKVPSESLTLASVRGG